MACMIPEYERFALDHAGEYDTEPEMEAAFARHIGAEFYHHQGAKMECIVWQHPSVETMCYLTGRGSCQLVEEILEGRWDGILHPVQEGASG